MYIAIAFFVFVVVIVFLLLRTRRGSKSQEFRMEDREAWTKKWNELEAMLEHGESHWQVAILEADKLFDRVLKSMHLHGETMGERLKFLTLTRTDLKFVWGAHSVRNRLAHETNYRLDRRTATETIAAYRRALKLLGVL